MKFGKEIIEALHEGKKVVRKYWLPYAYVTKRGYFSAEDDRKLNSDLSLFDILFSDDWEVVEEKPKECEPPISSGTNEKCSDCEFRVGLASNSFQHCLMCKKEEKPKECIVPICSCGRRKQWATFEDGTSDWICNLSTSIIRDNPKPSLPESYDERFINPETTVSFINQLRKCVEYLYKEKG